MARNELEAVEEAQRAAQARLGIIGAYLALFEWTGTVGVLNPAVTGVEWTAYAVKLVASMRTRSRRTAQAYYQLARAIDAGETLGVPEGDELASEVTMSRLRQRFLDELLEINSLGREVVEDADELSQFLQEEALKASPDNDRKSARGLPLSKVELDKYIQTFLDHEGPDATIPVEPFEWPTDTEFNVIDQQLTRYLNEKLTDLEGSLSKSVSNEDTKAEQREEALRKEHEEAGNKLASEVHKQGIGSGTDTLNKVSNVDSRVQVWARQTGPRPCAFCAMLASRGFIYKTRNSATKSYAEHIKADGFLGFTVNAYHPNCACSAISRWESTGENDLPELNGYLEKMWPQITDGYSGVDALNAWRRWLNDRYNVPEGQQVLDI